MERNDGISVKFYGVRGSSPICRKESSVYGGNTLCVKVKIDGCTIVFDCGSGGVILGKELSDTGVKKIHMLISHMHLDHIQGIPFFYPLFAENAEVDFYSAVRRRRGFLGQLKLMMRPPFWPVGPEMFKAKIRSHNIPADGSFYINKDIKIDTMKSNHPNDSTIFRLSYKNKSLVYALDYEHEPKSFKALSAFAKGSDLIIYDATYTSKEYKKYKGFGHSTWEKGVELAENSGAKRVALSHIHFDKSDEELLKIEEEIKKINPVCFFSKEGEEIIL